MFVGTVLVLFSMTMNIQHRWYKYSQVHSCLGGQQTTYDFWYIHIVSISFDSLLAVSIAMWKWCMFRRLLRFSPDLFWLVNGKLILMRLLIEQPRHCLKLKLLNDVVLSNLFRNSICVWWTVSILCVKKNGVWNF